MRIYPMQGQNQYVGFLKLNGVSKMLIDPNLVHLCTRAYETAKEAIDDEEYDIDEIDEDEGEVAFVRSISDEQALENHRNDSVIRPPATFHNNPAEDYYQ